ncbi:MAG: amidohydrolase family protein [Ilumatobacteraceae bacterium]
MSAYNSTGLIVHDADAHVMETPNWLRDHADASVRDRIEALGYTGGNELRQTGDPQEQLGDVDEAFERLVARHRSAEYLDTEAAEIMNRKNFAATGAFIAEDRGRALDLLGFASQLIFNTFHNTRLRNWEHSGDLALAIGAARAHNRAMVEFCSVDPRLLPTLYVPLADVDRAGDLAAEAIAMGAAALLIASGCPPSHSPSHIALDTVWQRASDAGVPIVFHVGGTGELIDPNYFRNGLPIPHDFHGGDENFRSVDYMGIPGPPAQTLATMIFDGVFERFPGLRVGVIEQGAIWVPSWMRQMEAAFDAFRRHEDRLRSLSMRPSEYVRRQMRFTPYPTEDVGWIIEQSGPEVCLFSSDYPHVEGGRRPIERFEASLAGTSPTARQAFYHDNFVDLMGNGLQVSMGSPSR